MTTASSATCLCHVSGVAKRDGILESKGLVLAKEALDGRESVPFFEAAQGCSPHHAKKLSEIPLAHLTRSTFSSRCFLPTLVPTALCPLRKEKAWVAEGPSLNLLSQARMYGNNFKQPNMVPLENCPTGPGSPVFCQYLWWWPMEDHLRQLQKEGWMSPGTQILSESHGSGVWRDLCELDHRRDVVSLTQRE